jgi:hypothetical protein
MNATLIDRFIALINPAWALRRLRARQALAHTRVVVSQASTPEPKPASQWQTVPATQVTDEHLVRGGQASWIPRRPPKEQNPWVRWEPQQPLAAMTERQFPGR